jgi:hypothetical protein
MVTRITHPGARPVQKMTFINGKFAAAAFGRTSCRQRSCPGGVD